jgi:hypothetical protein
MPKSKKQQVQARCVFCNRPKVDHAHIWPKWVRDLLPKTPSRVQSIAGGPAPPGRLDYRHKMFLGGVETKSARKVCPSCNRGWMRHIDLAAEEVGSRLILGQQTLLYRKDQETIASFVFLASLLIDLLNKVGDHIPQSDYIYFYEHKAPPPHWYVGIGHYADPPRIGVDISPSSEETRGALAVHSISTIVGALFTATQGTNPPGPPAVVGWPIQINRPHLVPIWPCLNEPIRFPSPLFPIGGRLEQDGGLARDISRRFPIAATNVFGRRPCF